ncbi:HAMP domain-containing sensor histidine kinase [Halalkalibacter krulwichiae]|uniref:histidine kinase n=1 Tax=Halalkalibacter krulwichiae TaxID=199441 RepID=A0A1X9MIP8_9BACI|nr:sensor histidine kinase [Halalkalibacter krulwichiae]ARK32674.1 Alkaline phosphatase synthesis sensor protein PhoR [Halalkalibacter krulwichiae]
MKISTKLALTVFAATTFVIILMSTSFYTLSKNFYKEQLQLDIESRLEGHREAIESHLAEETFLHIVLMERQREENAFVIFDPNLNVLLQSQQVEDRQLESYRDWLRETTEKSEYIETIAGHIPHIWSFEPFYQQQELLGYLFIDQDTGSFEEASSRMMMLTLVTALLTLLLAGMLAFFFSRKITRPLRAAAKETRKIAKGDFDVRLDTKGNDELAGLTEHISSMAIQLKQYRDTQQQFLTNVSHDLRTPLTYIKAYAALLKDQPLDQTTVQSQAEIIHQEAVRMEGLVRDLFELMKLEEGKIPLQLEETELVEFISNLTDRVRVELDQKMITVEVNANQPEIWTEIDVEKIARSLINLLSNAVRHTEEKGAIEIQIEQKQKTVTIAVSDTGEGIPPEDLPYIWNRFYRADKSRNSNSGGSGIGLAITKQLIELHKGKIDVSSTQQGTTFFIELPLPKR